MGGTFSTSDATASCSTANGWYGAARFWSVTEPLTHGSAEQMSWPALADHTSTYVDPDAFAAPATALVRARFTRSA